MSKLAYSFPIALFALLLLSNAPAHSAAPKKEHKVDPNEGFAVYNPLAGRNRELEMDVPAHAERNYLVRVDNYKRCEFDPYPIYDDDGNPTVSETPYTLICREKYCTLDFKVPEDHDNSIITYYEYDGKTCAPKDIDVKKSGKLDGHYVIDIEVPLKLIPYKKNSGKYIRPEKSEFGSVTDFSTSKSMAYIKITYGENLPDADTLELENGKVIMNLYKDRTDKGLEGASAAAAPAPAVTAPAPIQNPTPAPEAAAPVQSPVTTPAQ